MVRLMDNKIKTIYWANTLFSEADQNFNIKLVKILRNSGYKVFLPQEIKVNHPELNLSPTSWDIFSKDTSAILNSALLIACIDQESIDCGVACEIGIAYEAGIPIIGLYTDFRQYRSGNGKMYKNPYVIGAIEANGEIVSNVNSILKILPNYLKDNFKEHNNKSHITHFAQVAKGYSTFISNLERRYIPNFSCGDIVEKYILSLSPDRILDFGCGSGELLNSLSRKFNKKIFIGFDSSSTMISIASSSKRKNLDFYDDWPKFKNTHNHRIDLILVLFSLHDNPNQLIIMKDLFDLLNNNGYLLLLDLTQQDLPILTSYLIKNLALPLKSIDSRISATSISEFSKIEKIILESSSIHIPRIIFNNPDELIDYISFFGIDQGMDLPLGLYRNYGKVINNFHTVINDINYPFIDQRVFGEFLFKKL